jgi:hypothetical protein
MSTLERAIEIAASAHAGQVDKAGQPYILHPLRVMMAVRPECRTVAVLHDVVEDCPDWPIERLRSEGFSEAELAGIASVTRMDGEEYLDFVRRAGRDPIGHEVKHADLVDNLSPSRTEGQTQERIERYRKALTVLFGTTPQVPA